MAEWSFPRADDEYEVKGLNDSGIETFNDDCLKGLAREICQNSLDARRKDVPEKQPVVVEFNRFNLPYAQFPDRNAFCEDLERCRKFWKDRNDEKTEEFFSEALDAMSQLEIPCLRISDYYTTGLRGVSRGRDHKTTTPWSSLVMSSGVSKKAGISGGSFGIGKFASFSCSKIRTCFYSTLTDKDEMGFQGVARLVSFEADDGKITFGNGYYRENGLPLRESSQLDATFNRGAKTGTDVFVPAFCVEDSWFDDITASVLDGFLYAIFESKLEVRLHDYNGSSLVLNRGWLDEQYRGGALEGRPTVRFNYEVLKDTDAKHYFRKDIGQDGWLELRLKLAPGLDRRVAMIRETGMKIFAKKNFPASISFSGVLVVHGEMLNERIKKFENPQHTKWEPKRNPDDKGLLDVINNFCRDSLEALVQKCTDEELDAGLGDVLSADGESDKQEVRETLSAKIHSLDAVKRKKRRHITKSNSEEDGDHSDVSEDSDDVHGSGGGPGENENASSSDESHGGSSEGDGNGAYEDGMRNQPVLRKVKAGVSRFACTSEERGEYRMFIVPEVTDSEGVLAVNAVAELNTYGADIVSARTIDGRVLQVDGNQILGVGFKKGELVQINLKLAYSDYVSLEVEWYGATR